MPENNKKYIIFDATILNEIQLCAQRTYFAHEINLRPPVTATPLEEGGLLHVMLEAYYKGIKAGAPEVVYDNDKFKELVSFCVTIGEEYSVTQNLSPEEVSSVIYQFEEYTDHYRMDGIVPIEVEQPFLVPVFEDEELSISLAGKIDLIADVPNFGRDIVDHKKANRNATPSALSNQFSAYSFATGLRTVHVNKVGFQKTLSREERFRRYTLFYTEEQIERWKKNTIYWGQQYSFYIETGSWPENRTSCDKYGGCLYSPICEAATEEARNWIMATKYVIGKKWDVTEILKTGQENGNS